MDKDVQPVVDMLNDAFFRDSNAIHALCVNRVPCNIELADMDHIEVETTRTLVQEKYQVGALGLINGVLSVLGYPKICLAFSDKKIDGRHVIYGFYDLQKALDVKEEYEKNKENKE